MVSNVQEWTDELRGTRVSAVVCDGDEFSAGFGIVMPAGGTSVTEIDESGLRGAAVTTQCRECAADMVELLERMVEQFASMLD